MEEKNNNQNEENIRLEKLLSKLEGIIENYKENEKKLEDLLETTKDSQTSSDIKIELNKVKQEKENLEAKKQLVLNYKNQKFDINNQYTKKQELESRVSKFEQYLKNARDEQDIKEIEPRLNEYKNSLDKVNESIRNLKSELDSKKEQVEDLLEKYNITNEEELEKLDELEESRDEDNNQINEQLNNLNRMRYSGKPGALTDRYFTNKIIEESIDKHTKGLGILKKRIFISKLDKKLMKFLIMESEYVTGDWSGVEKYLESVKEYGKIKLSKEADADKEYSIEIPHITGMVLVRPRENILQRILKKSKNETSTSKEELPEQNEVKTENSDLKMSVKITPEVRQRIEEIEEKIKLFEPGKEYEDQIGPEKLEDGNTL